MPKTPQRPAAAPGESGALRAPAKPKSSARATAKAAADSEPAAPTPAELIVRVTRAIERELAQIEAIVGGKKVTPARRTEAERRARTLASLARTLAEVARLRAAQAEARDHADDDAVPRDLDEFRRTLERRLALMAEQRQSATDRGDDTG